LFQHGIEGAGVGEWLKPAVLKIKSPIRYLAENSTKSLCQPQDSNSFYFSGFALFLLVLRQF
jgi:hypothetical protein